jgi:hypothetical protein
MNQQPNRVHRGERSQREFHHVLRIFPSRATTGLGIDPIDRHDRPHPGECPIGVIRVGGIRVVAGWPDMWHSGTSNMDNAAAFRDVSGGIDRLPSEPFEASKKAFFQEHFCA